MNEWLAVVICIVAGLLIGSIAGRVVRSQLGKPSRPDALQVMAVPAGSLVFTIALIVSLVTALGIVDEHALDDLPTALLNYLPKGLSALVVLLAGNALAQLASTIVAQSASSATGESERRMASVVRMAIVAASAILAANQAGIDTTIINLAAAALFAAIGLSAALLIGFGGRDIARQIAAGRATRSIVKVGDRVRVGDVSGSVAAIHPVAFEVATANGTVVVPHVDALDGRLVVERN